MPFFHKNVSSSASSSSSPASASPSSSLPSSPSVSSKETSGNVGNFVNNRDQSFLQRKLTRQRKLRHATNQDLGLHFADQLNSPPDSPDTATRQKSPGCSDLWFSSAVSQPLPLPELPLPLPLPSPLNLLGSPEEGPSSVQRRNSADHIVSKSTTCSRICNNKFSQDANFHSTGVEVRLNISARSAPSSPMMSPRMSNAGDISPRCNTMDSTNCASTFCKGQADYLNVEGVADKLGLLASPRSAPTSSLSSPVVSPQRSYTDDFLPYFVASQACQTRSSLDIPDLGWHAGHTSQGSPVKTVHSTDCSPFHSPSLQSPRCNPKSLKKISFPLCTKLLPGRSEWPESNNHISAHPLPLPPGAAPPQALPSPPAISQSTVEKPNASFKKLQWQKGKLIGRGTYGSVYVGTNTETGALCAMKEVDIIPDDNKSAECIKQLEQEIRLLQHLKHPNIVQYYGSEIVDDHFYIYLEYVFPGSINRYIHEHCGGHMTESIVRNITRHILSGLSYLHSTKTIHSDIKGANLLVDSSGIVKLADFGMAKHLAGLYELSLKGSPHWMAPEVLKAVMLKDANPDLALVVDIWSLGCTIIEMFTGRPPWGELHGPQAMFKVLNKTPNIPEAISPEGKDFLCLCLQRNPADRPSATKLLEHPFVQHSSEVLACRQASSAANHLDKSHNRHSAAQKIDSMPISPTLTSHYKRKASTCSSITEDVSETKTSSLFEGTKTSSSGSSPRWQMQEETPHHASPFQSSFEPIVGKITKATNEYRREAASSWEKEMHVESYYPTLEQSTIIPFETSLERTVPSIASPHSEEYPLSLEGDTSNYEAFEWKSTTFISTLLEEYLAETMTSKELGETSEGFDQQWSKATEEVHTQSRLFLLLDSMGLTDLPKEVEWEKLTLISLMDNELSELPESLSCPNLQALFLQKNLKLRTIPASFFNSMTALQILNLSRTRIKTLPDSLFGLKKLKRLFLNHCELLSSLSSRVSELELLEVLDLEGTAIMALPIDVGLLKNLTSLEVSFCEPMNNRRADQSQVVIPDGVICQLSQLQELNIDVSPEDERWKASVESVVFEVCRLTSLHTLEFYFPRAQLLPLLSLVSHLSHFRFVVGDHTSRIISRLPLEVEFELERHDKWLKYVNGDDVLEEVKTVLKYASAFFLDRHKTVKTLSEFGIRNMAQLKCCVIGECDELQTIIDADLKIVEAFGEGKASLEALEYLYIYYVKNLSSIWKGIVDNNSFIGLKYLTMHMCLELTIVFTSELLANLCSLEELTIDDCPKITKLVSSNDYEDQTNLVLPSLKKISLHFLPELLSISDVVTISPKMEFMSFYDCPNLKNISTKKDFNKNLRKIKGELSWWHDLEWDSTDEKYYCDCIFTAVD